MPPVKNPRRVTKKAVRAPRATKRRSLKPRAMPAAPSSAPDALLIAQFAEALGQTPPKRTRTGRRSLAQALAQSLPSGDPIAMMPGARVAQPKPARMAPGRLSADAALLPPPPPCQAAAQRRRLNGHISGAASWCVAFLVTAGIVSAAAYGFASQAPLRSPQPITTASASQF